MTPEDTGCVHLETYLATRVRSPPEGQHAKMHACSAKGGVPVAVLPRGLPAHGSSMRTVMGRSSARTDGERRSGEKPNERSYVHSPFFVLFPISPGRYTPGYGYRRSINTDMGSVCSGVSFGRHRRWHAPAATTSENRKAVSGFGGKAQPHTKTQWAGLQAARGPRRRRQLREHGGAAVHLNNQAAFSARNGRAPGPDAGASHTKQVLRAVSLYGIIYDTIYNRLPNVSPRAWQPHLKCNHMMTHFSLG